MNRAYAVKCLKGRKDETGKYVAEWARDFEADGGWGPYDTNVHIVPLCDASLFSTKAEAYKCLIDMQDNRMPGRKYGIVMVGEIEDTSKFGER